MFGVIDVSLLYSVVCSKKHKWCKKNRVSNQANLHQPSDCKPATGQLRLALAWPPPGDQQSFLICPCFLVRTNAVEFLRPGTNIHRMWVLAIGRACWVTSTSTWSTTHLPRVSSGMYPDRDSNTGLSPEQRLLQRPSCHRTGLMQELGMIRLPQTLPR